MKKGYVLEKEVDNELCRLSYPTYEQAKKEYEAVLSAHYSEEDLAEDEDNYSELRDKYEGKCLMDDYLDAWIDMDKNIYLYLYDIEIYVNDEKYVDDCDDNSEALDKLVTVLDKNFKSASLWGSGDDTYVEVRYSEEVEDVKELIINNGFTIDEEKSGWQEGSDYEAYYIWLK